MADFILYSYFRSSASHRVRIALNLKVLKYEYRAVHLVKDGGEQYKPEYKKLNPISQVPCLIHNNRPISQSMAIIDYLDHVAGEPRLFPNEPYERALTIQLCELINSGIQPLQNTAVVGELEKALGASAEQKKSWIQYWIKRGLDGLEETLVKTAGDFCIGNHVTAADCFLVPQLFSARRFEVDLTPYKNIRNIEEHTKTIEAFQLAEPSRQPDYQA